jgi:hypothetical protein
MTLSMRRFAFAVTMVALAGAVVAARAQSAQTTQAGAPGRPDFSGRWTTDPDPAVAAPPGGAGRGQGPGAGRGRGDMGSGWGSPITITQDATQLTVQYAFFGRGDMQPPLKFAYALDGSETRNSVMMGRGVQVQVSTSSWDAERLVIATVHTFADPGTGKPVKAEVKQVLSLASPTSLIVETTRAGVLGGPATTTRTTYRKL